MNQMNKLNGINSATSLTDNDKYSYLNYYYLHLLRNVKSRLELLTWSHQNSLYDKYIDFAGKFAGRRGTWNLETGILKRLVKYGYSKFFKDFEPLNQSDFQKSLDKGEELMKDGASFKGNARRLHRATLRVLTLCSFTEKFSPMSTEEAWRRINTSASSGFNLFARKGTVKEQLFNQLESLFNGDHSFFEWPMTRGFRLQLRESKGQLDRKIRLVYPYPGVITLLEAMFAGNFIDHFCKSKTFYVTGKTGSQVGSLLDEKFRNVTNGLCSLDISAFDQHMLNEVIISAFWILKSNLILTAKESQLFDLTVEYFCTSLMVSKNTGAPAFGFIKNHGIPSGSGFTNMIGTIAHAIILEYLEEGIVSRSLICGDDNIFDIEKTDVQKLFKGYRKVFNLPISLEKTDFFKSSLDFYFLGFNWKEFKRHISLYLSLNQCVWHSDYLTDLTPFEREVARASSVLLNGINGEVVFKTLFPDVMKNLADGEDVRFRYLQGYLPPEPIKTQVFSRGSDPRYNQSLIHHLRYGYLIR